MSSRRKPSGGPPPRSREEILNAVARTDHDALRLRALVSALSHALDRCPGVWEQVQEVYNAIPALKPERWTDGGLAESWLKEELESAETLVRDFAAARAAVLAAEFRAAGYA